MENETVATATTPTPALSTQSSAAPASPAAVPPGEEWRKMSSEAFAQRIAEAKASGEKSFLKATGFTSLEDAKTALAESKALKEAQMTAQQKLEAKLAEVAPKADRADALSGIVGEYASQEFAALPKPLQDFIAATAGDDPAARLKAITAARASGMLAPAPAVVPPAPPTTPATTMAPPGPAALPPPPPGTLSPRQQWDKLRSEGKSMSASSFYAANKSAIDAEISK